MLHRPVLRSAGARSRPLAAFARVSEYYRLILLLLISALAIAVLSLLGAAGERFRRAAGGEAGST